MTSAVFSVSSASRMEIVVLRLASLETPRIQKSLPTAFGGVSERPLFSSGDIAVGQGTGQTHNDQRIKAGRTVDVHCAAYRTAGMEAKAPRASGRPVSDPCCSRGPRNTPSLSISIQYNCVPLA